ncbi:hypothetical protein ACWGK1_28745 [Streptomyces wedmorensis]
MALGGITTLDLNGWQYRAVDVLDELVKAGLKAERRPLEWTITTNGALRGEVDRYRPEQTDRDRRAIFDEWCHVLNAGAPRESKRVVGGVEVRAVFKVPTTRGEVQGSLLPEIDEPLDEE